MCFAGEIPTANVYAIDPFILGYDDADNQSTALSAIAHEQALSADGLSEAWGLALAYEQSARHGCRHHLIRTESVKAAALFSDASLDWVFVDGLHTYEGVVADILAWLPKLRSPGGGFIFNVSFFLEVYQTGLQTRLV